MKYYQLTARLLSPLIVQQNRQAYAPSALDYLPGSTLRGALAAKHFRTGKKAEDTAFQRLFLKNPACFPNMLATPDKKTTSQVLPLTAVSCKREPGFQAASGHGVSDVLAVTAASRIEEKPPDLTAWQCPSCGQDMKPFSGVWNGDTDSPAKFDPTLISNRHTGIDRTTGTVANSIFFMTQAIAEYYKGPNAEDDPYRRQYLCGGLFMEEEQAEYLKPLLEGPVFTGADRTRGFGELELSIDEADPPSSDMPAWNSAFKKKLRMFLGHHHELPGMYFSIKTESHAIFADRFLRPVSEIEELCIESVEPVMKIIRSETIRGWQAAWGLAKPDDIAVSMGSVFLYRYTGDDIAALENHLGRLTISGIGLRREEGFGRISVCSPFHTEFATTSEKGEMK